MLDFINENSIVVCNSYYKKKILDYFNSNNELLNFKIININEFINNMTFAYDTKTIYYIMHKYNINYDTAIVYLKSMIYVYENSTNEKINFLYTLKKELEDKKLIKYNDLFKHYLVNKNIVFYNINYDNKILNYLCKDLDYKYINDIKQKKEKSIICFDNIYDEVIYIGTSIIELLEKVNIDKIKLVGVTSEYIYPIKLIFSYLNLNINVEKNYLYGTEIGKFFLDNLDQDITKSINLIKDKYNDENIINLIINICNKYYWCDNFLEIKELLIYEFKNTYIQNDKLENEIEIIDYFDIDVNSDNYYYLLGFNNENIPVCYKDTDYISDDLCTNKETSNERYLRERNLLLDKINGVDNLIITYKKHSYFGEYLISNLNDELRFNVVEKEFNNISYSKVLSNIKLGKLLDNYEKYGEINKELGLLNNSIDTNYKTYNNSFKGISNNSLYEYLNNKLLLSYSSIDNYYKCAFKYYINNILKIDEMEETFSTYVGSFMHYILSICNNDSFDFDSEINKYIKESTYELDAKELFFLDKIKDYLKFIISVINDQKKISKFDKALYEQKIFVEKNNKIKITLMGIIDKVMYLEKDGKNYLSLVDYKTGIIDTNIKYLKYGLQMQLPMYAYLISKSNLFNDSKIAGLYYQKLLDNEIKSTNEHDYIEEKKNNLKLQGLSTNNTDILDQFDSTYKNSELIKGMKTTSNGFSAYSKVFGDMELNDMLNITEEKINEAITKILSGNFEINPKKIGKDNISCKYCKYRDICYKTEDDVVLIEEGDASDKMDE